MNPFLRYLADKNSAHTQTDRQTDRHTPMITIPCGLRRAGNNDVVAADRLSMFICRLKHTNLSQFILGKV